MSLFSGPLNVIYDVTNGVFRLLYSEMKNICIFRLLLALMNMIHISYAQCQVRCKVR